MKIVKNMMIVPRSIAIAILYPKFCKKVAESYEEEIRQAIISAFSK